MRGTALKSLLNLAVAALIAQAAPESEAHLLSCGFTNALRTIQSAETAKKLTQDYFINRSTY